MEEKNNKMGFFSKLKTAIFGLEEYDKFLEQKVHQAVAFFVLVILMLTAVFSAIYSYQYSKQLDRAFSYIKNEMPDFTYENGIFKSSKNIEAYDEEFNVRLFIDSDDNLSDKTLTGYKNKIGSNSLGLLLLKDELTVIINGTEANYSYSDLEQFIEDANISNKQDLVETLDSIGVSSIIIMIFLELLIVYFIQNFLSLFANVIMVAAFGYIAAGTAKVKFPASKLFILATYSVTLPNILYFVYIICNVLTGFYIKYFEIFYMLICCVYIFAAIFMIKSDIIKQQQEIMAIGKVQKEVKEEADKQLDEGEEVKEEKDDKENKEDKKDESQEDPVIDENKEPDGSEI